MTDRWPRLMQQRTAAAYCDMSVELFLSLKPPPPIPVRRSDGGVPRYDRHAIDAWLDKLCGTKKAVSYSSEPAPAA